MIVEFILENEELWSFLSCCIILIGVIIAIIEIHYMRKSAHSELLMTLYKMWDSDSLIESRNLIKSMGNKLQVMNKIMSFMKTNSTDYLIALRVCNYFENLGLLVKIKSLKVKDVKIWMGEGIIHYYEDILEDYIIQRRQQIGKEAYFENFQYLKDKCKEKTLFDKLKEKISY